MGDMDKVDVSLGVGGGCGCVLLCVWLVVCGGM